MIEYLEYFYVHENMLSPQEDRVSLVKLHKKYIKNTAPKQIVFVTSLQLCYLTKKVFSDLKLTTHNVYLTTIMLKHMYDKRVAEEFDYLLYNLYKIVKYPDHVYKNKPGGTGDYFFTKTLDNLLYGASIEVSNEQELFIVTAFRTTEKYLNNFEKIWSWEGGNPHLNAFDSDSFESV